jgi:YegS/Rv2252/BmrU family lipid kinase
VTSVAVVAHPKKRLGGGLDEQRQTLADAGVTDPQWFEVPKSKKAPAKARQAVEAGADLVFVWGGDGMVQRCMDALVGSGATVAILPAGTANLLASNLGIPQDLSEAVRIGLHGRRRPLDLGVINGEHFAVMAGTGFDALMIRDADRGLKDKVGRMAYLSTGWRHLRIEPIRMRVDVDGDRWFEGDATCALLGNVSSIMGGITAFDDARPDDGCLEVGVVTATGRVQWARVLARMALSRSERSPFVEITRGTKIDIKLARPMPYELDGGDRSPTKRLKVRVASKAVTVCCPDQKKEKP